MPSDKNLGFMTIEEKYDFARKYKDAGNVFFKEGRYVNDVSELNDTPHRHHHHHYPNQQTNS